MKPFIIGICGGSGSGKTTLLKKIKSALGHENVSVFTMDNYYLPKEEQARDKNDSVNFDLPSALNEKQLCLDLQLLISGEEIKVKEYFFNAPVNETKTVSIPPNKVIIVEGLFLFYFEAHWGRAHWASADWARAHRKTGAYRQFRAYTSGSSGQ